jgi:hypothetical protein
VKPWNTQREYDLNPRGKARAISQERMTQSKEIFVVLPLLFATPSFGDDAFVRWKGIVEVIATPGVSNTVAGIASGITP